MNACHLQSVREVRVSSDPRLLAGVRIGELLDALCVKTDNADPEDDNACTRAMKYAGCTPERLREECIESPATPGCASCAEEDVSAEHSAFQQLSDRHLGQGICMAAGRYGEAMPCPSS